MATYVNNDGIEVRFGSDIGNRGQKGGVTTGAGKRRELVMEVDLPALGAGGTGFTLDTDNDGTKDGFSAQGVYLPVNARIENVTLVELEAPAGGTSFSVGTFQEDGTVVDADGLLTDAGADGAQIGEQVDQANGPFFVAAKATGTYTAGRVKVIVEYMTV